MNKPNLNRLTRKWTKILRLQDWKIDIAYAKPDELSDTNTLGECNWNRQHKAAKIFIADPAMVTNGLEIEFVVIHELIHLHLAGVYDDTQTTQAEQAINLLTHAFYTLGGEEADD